MADQRPWWKLWVSALTDDSLEALPLEDWARWARLGAHLKLHGEGGTVTVERPSSGARSQLERLWRVRGWDGVLTVARRLPGVTVEVLDGTEFCPKRIRLGMRNWKKYQEDTSRERNRNYRERQRQRDGHDRHTEPPAQSPRDGAERHARDGVEEKRSRRDSPQSPHGVTRPTPPTRYDWPSAEHKALSLRPGASKWQPGPYPYDAFHHDCPEPGWRGQCVRTEYASAHPNGHPTRMDGRPKQCPAHLQTSTTGAA